MVVVIVVVAILGASSGKSEDVVPPPPAVQRPEGSIAPSSETTDALNQIKTENEPPKVQPDEAQSAALNEVAQ